MISKDNLRSLSKDINETLTQAYSSISEYEICHLYPTGDPSKGEFLEREILSYFSKIELQIQTYLEIVNLNNLRFKFITDSSLDEKDKLKLEHSSWGGFLYSSYFGVLRRYGSLIHTLADNEDDSEIVKYERERLISILQGVPKMISDWNIEATKEKDVEDAVFKVLVHLFPSSVKQIGIGKSAKLYKPDLGVRDLKTAVEYKYASDLTKLKSCLDGIFADIHGYSNSLDWTHFIALFYTSHQIWTQAQLDAHISQSNIPDNWIFILVHK